MLTHSFFTYEDIRDYVLTILGHESITVELTDKDIQEAVALTLNTYNKYRPKIQSAIIPITSSVTDYVLPYERSFRGVIDVIFEDSATTLVLPFPREYYPWTGIYSADISNISEWHAYNRGVRSAVGSGDMWFYDKDSRILRILKRQGSSKVKYYYIQDRYLLQHIVNVTGATYTTTLNNGKERLFNLLPESLQVRYNNTVYILDATGNLQDKITGSSLGTYDYATSVLTLNFPTALSNEPIQIDVNEVRSSDFSWFAQFVLGQVVQILASKRTRFGGTLDTTDLSGLALDVEVLERYREKISKLEEEGRRWMLDWITPRSRG